MAPIPDGNVKERLVGLAEDSTDESDEEGGVEIEAENGGEEAWMDEE